MRESSPILRQRMSPVISAVKCERTRPCVIGMMFIGIYVKEQEKGMPPRKDKNGNCGEQSRRIATTFADTCCICRLTCSNVGITFSCLLCLVCIHVIWLSLYLSLHTDISSSAQENGKGSPSVKESEAIMPGSSDTTTM